MTVTSQEAPLVGRSPLVDELVSAVGSRRGGGALVLGPAGYGKTALAGALGRQVGAIAVVGSPTLSSVPFGALAPLLPELSAADSRSLVAVLRALQARVREEASRSGAAPVIVVDDAHALDEHSAMVLSQMVTAGTAQLLLLARPGAGLSRALLALWRDGLLARHDLRLLTEEEAHALCVQRLDGDIVRTASHLLARASGGNPAWLLALLEAAERSAQLVRRNGTWILTESRLRPDAQLVDLIRLQTIGNEDERTVLEAVSLAEPVPLAALLESGRPAAVGALEAGGVLTIAADPQQLVRPALPLYGEVIRWSVPLGRSIDLRRTVVPHVDLEPPSAEDLVRAVNWALDCGAPVTDQQLLQASMLANRVFDAGSALRASAAIRDVTTSGAAGVQAAWAHFSIGDTATSQRVLDAAAPRAADPATAASAALLRAQILLRQGAAPVDLQEAADAWRASVRRIETARGPASSAADSSRVGAELLTLHARHLDGDFEAGEPALHALIDHPAGTDETRMVARSLLGEALHATGRPESAATVTTESMRMLQRNGRILLPYSEFVIVRHVFALVDSGRWAAARETLAACLDDPLCDPRHLAGVHHVMEGWILVRQGLMRSALRELRVAIEGLRESDVDQLLPFALGLSAYAAAMSGDTVSAATYGDEFFDVPCTMSEHRRIIGAAHVAAARALTTDLSTHGVELSRLAVAAGEKGLLSAQQLVLELILRTSESPELDQLAGVSARNEGPAAGVLEAMARALLARDVDSLLEAGMQAGEAHYLLLAAECSGAAVRVAEGTSAAPETKGRALRMLAETRSRLEGITAPALETSAAGNPLTRRQKDIAILVLQGLSNRQIAEELDISHRTVEGHLYQLFTKLDISSREELAEVF
jgi:DNA-binding NarL/FixJ family response regulator